ncbi:hypothetical protein [Inquilinus limosus]|uniref:Uncharacterized protein n=1 Tax=Inquilinus limosus TaxID=171674 RepID=A0A211Z0K1_9PROT|nr:hypothetical protein [Inquilinus limosus]OWJ58647.1 hypothetical protein BWR60_33195 [Inquilinus limosus]
MSPRLPIIIYLWFALDLLLALFPPLHWAAGGNATVLGAPAILVYLFGTSVFIAASVVAAYFSDPAIRATDPDGR